MAETVESLAASILEMSLLQEALLEGARLLPEVERFMLRVVPSTTATPEALGLLARVTAVTEKLKEVLPCEETKTESRRSSSP